MKILVTGGAGYIENHIGYNKTILFKNLDLSDRMKTEKLIKNEQSLSLMHFFLSFIFFKFALLKHQYYLSIQTK